MRRIVSAALFLMALSAVPAYCQTQESVARAKADLAASGAQVENKACTDFEIAKIVAGRVPGAGLLTKACCGDANDPNRSHCEYKGEWYAHDVVAFADGTIFDIAEDGGGRNGPRWDIGHNDDPSKKYVAASVLGLTGVVPGAGPGLPPVVIQDTPAGVDVAGLLSQIADLQKAIVLIGKELDDKQHQISDLSDRIRATDSAVGAIVIPKMPTGCKVQYLACRLVF